MSAALVSGKRLLHSNGRALLIFCLIAARSSASYCRGSPGCFLCKAHGRTLRQVERLCRSATQTDFGRLSDHVDKERIANAGNITTDIIKLSGGFHLLLAELASSDFLFTMMRDLVSRTSLITAVYRKADYFNCGPDEHAEIVDAILQKNVARAVRLMAHHLDHVERQLDLREVNDYSDDLSSVFA